MNRNFRKLWFAIVIAGFYFFLLGGTATADCVETFSWVPNTESDLAGYKIYYGQTDGGTYPNVVDVGNPEPVDGRIQGTVTGLTCGEEYFFVCVAVNDTGVEGAYSSQAAVTVDSSVPGSPVNLMIIE
jgi:hypothetical protein